MPISEQTIKKIASKLPAASSVAAGLLLLLLTAGPSATGKERIRYDFGRMNELKENWGFRGGRFGVPKTKISIAPAKDSADGTVLVLESPRGSGVFMTRLPKEIWKKYPVMRWRWRVIKPVRVKPGTPEPDDQAAVVYFGDGTLLRQRCVGYRWEVRAPVGAEEILKYGAGTMTVKRICMRNKSTPPGKWVVEERNVAADYRRAFGVNPKSHCILSVGANSQYSQSHTRVEIDYIEFLPGRCDMAKKQTIAERKQL